MSAEQNKALIRRHFEEVWNQGHLELVDDYVAPNYVMHDPSNPHPVAGIAGLKGFITAYRTAIPDLRFSIEDMIAEGDQVAYRWKSVGTHQGDLMGIAPTGRQSTVTGILISRFEAGKWIEDWNNWDTLGMLQQLGVIPAPGQAA